MGKLKLIARHGLAAFVAHLMPAFSRAVGAAWLAGCTLFVDTSLVLQRWLSLSKALRDAPQ